MTKLLAAVAALVLVVVLVLGRHRDREAASAPPTTTSAPRVAAAAPVVTGSGSSGRIKRITPEQRRELEHKIAAARAARAHAGTTTPSPALPASHEGGIENLPAGALDMLKEALPYLADCYPQGSGAPKQAVALISMHGDPEVGTLIDPGEIHDEQQQPIDQEIASCLATTLQSLQLPPLREGDSVQLQLSLRF